MAAATVVSPAAGDAMLDGSQGVVSSSVPNTFQQSLDADAAGVGDWQVHGIFFAPESY